MDALTGYSGLRSSAEQLLDDVDALLGLAGGQAIDNFRSALRRPAVVAVTGRVNTGKSTLVNSLISAKLAPTSAQETTALLCRYVYGAPARAEAVLDSGDVVPVPLTGIRARPGDLRPETIDYLQVHVQAAALRPVTVVDTPGLGSAATDNSRRTESRMLGGADPQDGPDALLYLVRDVFRPDDEEFIARFRSGPAPALAAAPLLGWWRTPTTTAAARGTVGSRSTWPERLQPNWPAGARLPRCLSLGPARRNGADRGTA